MKKVIIFILILVLSFSIISCGSDGNKDEGSKTNEYTIEITENDGAKTYTFSRMLTSVSDLEALDLSDEYKSVCAIIFSLQMYEEDPAISKEMLEYINGPEDVSEYDINFIKNQIDQYPYVMRSYFDNTSPDNDYSVSDVSITIKENSYSRDEDGYVTLWLHSSGADSDRSVKLRKKESTSEWFLFSDSYKGLMAGIRIPTSLDKWA